MSNDLRVSSRQQIKPTRRTLSVGVGDGRENGLRESTRALRARKVKRSVLRNASSEDVAAFERVWEDVKHSMVTPSWRTELIERAKRMLDDGTLETDEALDVCVDGILGRRTDSDDPELRTDD